MTIKQLLGRLSLFRADRNVVDPRRADIMERAHVELSEEVAMRGGNSYESRWLKDKLSKCSETLDKLSDPTLDAMVNAHPGFRVTDFLCNSRGNSDDDIRNEAIFFPVSDASPNSHRRNQGSGIIGHVIDRLVNDGAVQSRLLTKDDEVVVSAVLKVFLHFRANSDGSLNESVVSVMVAHPELADDLIAYIERVHDGDVYTPLGNVDARRFLIERDAPVASLAEGML